MRHLGRVRANAKVDEVRRVLLVEALARTMKCQLRSLYREKMKQITVPSSDPFREITVEFFNLVIGAGEYAEKSREYWEGPLKKDLLEKFEKIFSDKDLSDNFSLRSFISHQSMSFLMLKLSKMMNIIFSKDASDELRDRINSLILVVSDVSSLDTKIKHLNLVDYAAGMALIYKSETAQDSTAERLLSVAEKMLTV